MDYYKDKLVDGINIHYINDYRFKTNYAIIFLTLPLRKENITKIALIPEVLKNGSKNIKNNKELSEKLDFMYGASFGCGLDKVGDNVVLKFFIECIDDTFLPEKNNNLKKAIDTLFEIVFNPQIIDNGFNEKYVEIEKEKLAQIIKSIKDDKDQYSFLKTINLMYGEEGFGINKYGYLEDIQNINRINLLEEYKTSISTSKIDIIVSGRLNETIKKSLKNYELLKNLLPRNPEYKATNPNKETKAVLDSYKEIKENDEVIQGKIVIGLDILKNSIKDIRFSTIIYNSIFGNGVNSKLFQIVREKNSLAYTTKSEYIVQKNNIFIRCGIEINNYEKTKTLIIKLLNDMKEGNFTDDDIIKAKEYIWAGIEKIEQEQDSMILFIFEQELSANKITIEEYKKKIMSVTKEEILEIAKSIQINTIYFLKDGEKSGKNN